jgi:hypothetical protein
MSFNSGCHQTIEAIPQNSQYHQRPHYGLPWDMLSGIL